ncbi:unnamed protein product [Rotaria magnacalcarata]|uniref:G-protein coupled receptors family 1 profile domain-containing protein n=1 Tax=Rotaria magnacalcarata TaxID=392030 RepID=A0A816QH19_9BILA|nr:unnamed protein product [Rotaria magnacalcarata]CAF2071468.1 unnamed protein product [Rotaria magnacalcarata]CAF3914037.1 unnamed protein product [Rotaria magnacalcarata]CAF4015088.1 unnamed protein product [Rotaria magnacalcarata]
MVKSSYNESLIELLDTITIQLDRYAANFIFLFGVVGNVLNIFVLSQRTFRSNSCAWIFLASSFVNLISIVSGLITVMIGGWTTNPANTIGWICKLRAHIVFSTRTIAPWLIVLATIDRWLLSSINAIRRRKSTLKNAQRWTAVIIILSMLLYAQMFYCYEANLTDTPLQCYDKTAVCRYLTDLSFGGIAVVAPLMLMILFGLLTIINVRETQHRVQSLTRGNSACGTSRSSIATSGRSQGKSTHRTQHSLLRMLFVQVAVLSILTVPLSLDRFYSTFSSDNGSAVNIAINSFIYNAAILLYFISNGMPFYIYTMCGGSVFHKALYDFLFMMKRKLMLTLLNSSVCCN